MSEEKKSKNKSQEEEKKKKKGAFDEFGEQVEKFANKTAESIRKAIDRALASRNTVLTIRVNDDSNDKINRLVESGLFKTRSESAAFLIMEGIKAQQGLFDKIEGKLKRMEKIKQELRSIVSEEIEKGASAKAKDSKSAPKK
jgi:Arc/MetJ-type ribon-helix-helix transcriptional regulator